METPDQNRPTKTKWLDGMEQPLCELCLPQAERVAEYRDSVPDARYPGCSRSEAGYRTMFLCLVHAMERRQVATSRVVPIFPTLEE